MSLLDFARGPALQFSFAVFVFGVLWRLSWLLFLPGSSDKSVPRPGAPSAFASAVKGFARHMWLPGPISQSSMFSLVNGYVFHLGLAIIVFGFGPHILVLDGLFGFSWPNLPSGLIQVVSVITVASLVAALARRLSSPVLRLLSTSNDYFSWLMTITPVVTGLLAVSHLGARYETLLAVHMLSVAALLIWFPFGKLMHAFLVFLTRTRTGVFYGRRGVQIYKGSDTLNERVVVDPITRIEGHLRVEAETAADGSITGAWSSGTMVRGIELILKGRDPREAWAFAQRICGVCTLVHGIASVRAVENALDYKIPPNAQLIRNLMIAAQYVHDHVMHFYHLHALDWVDVVSALKADPAATSQLAQSISSWPKSSPGYFADTQKKLKGFVETGQLGIFANGFWGNPGFKLPPEANLMAVAHYLEALAWQREVVQIHTIFGGKNPHPNFLVGGAPSPIIVDSTATSGVSATAVNMTGLGTVKSVIASMKAFVEQVYLPDTLAIASFYKDWFARGEGVGNFLTYGDFPEKGMDDPSSWLIPSGAILNRDLSTIHPIDLNDPAQIQEFVSHSWYDYGGGKNAGLHPYDGETSLNYTGPKPPYDQLDVEQSYSWLKSPRWKGNVMEVGPLARVLMLYAKGHEPTKELAGMALSKLDLPLEAMFSTMGRTAARTLESKIIVDQMSTWYDNLLANLKAGDQSVHNPEKWEPSTWPKEARGVGFMEAPRGALAHWVVIKDGRIDNYQAVVPSTWNAGPRDDKGQPGPYEAALMDRHSLYDPKQPLEIQRTIHSFDPCIACAVHVVDPDGEELMQLQVR